MHGHGNDPIEISHRGSGGKHHAAERPGEAFHFGVFEEMNEIAEGAFITAERVGCIEVHLTLAADRTEVSLIQGKGFDKGRSAAATRVGGLQRLGQTETGGTDRDARNTAEGQLTEPAFIGEKKIEKTRGQRLDTGQQ
jgi:hypothetical protein